jgi:hypothetical protein
MIRLAFYCFYAVVMLKTSLDLCKQTRLTHCIAVVMFHRSDNLNIVHLQWSENCTGNCIKMYVHMCVCCEKPSYIIFVSVNFLLPISRLTVNFREHGFFICI